MRGCEKVFHLAALIAIPYSYVAPASYVDTNIHGTLNVLQAARDFDISRVVHTSTSETYSTAQFVPITEDHPLVGQSPYAASPALKQVADLWGLPLVEDSAEALGSWRGNIHCGLFGAVGTLSFNGNKLIITGGGGSLITNDTVLAQRAMHSRLPPIFHTPGNSIMIA